jgi:hypothetical protein
LGVGGSLIPAIGVLGSVRSRRDDAERPRLHSHGGPWKRPRAHRLRTTRGETGRVSRVCEDAPSMNRRRSALRVA